MLHAEALRCNFLPDPSAIEVTAPILSWKFCQSGMDRGQSAFRIHAASSCGKLLAGEYDLWDSGVQESTALSIRYQGSGIAPRRQVFWNVTVCDRDGNWSTESEPACFTFGVAPDTWHGCWIGGFRRLRGCIDLPEGAECATVYAASPAMFELYIDGERVEAPLLQPADTNHPARIGYAVYDVTAACRNGGKKAFEFLLAPGWQVLGFPRRPEEDYDFRLAVRIFLDFADGSVREFSSGADWEGTADSPVISSHLYHGEHYDARLETVVPYWRPCRTEAEETRHISPPAAPPIRVVQERRFQTVEEIRPGVFVLDFGKNIAGWCRLSFFETAPEGRRIELRFGEFRKKDGSVDLSTMRLARSTDVYHSCAGEQCWRPHFTNHGFRFVEVIGWDGIPDAEQIVAEEVRNDLAYTGSLHCSDSAVQQVLDAMVLTQKANFHDKPTDCPQRDERLGWLGGGHSSLPGCAFNFDAHAFYRKWYRDILDGIDKESGESLFGQTPNVWNACTGMPMHYAHFSIPWKLFLYYGDREVIVESYPLLRRNLEWLRTWKHNGIFTDELNLNYGDWLGSEFTPHGPVDNALYYAALKRMEFFAEELGKTADAAEYAAEAEEVRKTFNLEWLSEAGHYLQNPHASQALNAMALVLGLVPEEVRPATEAFLLWNVEYERGAVMATGGYVGMQFILLALEELGRRDLIFEIFRRREYPSWGYMLEHGATTLWERWEWRMSPEMNGHNQFAQAACVYFLYRAVAGITWPMPEQGKRVIHLIPDAAACDVDCAFETPWGRAAMCRKGNEVTVEVPPGICAVIDSAGWSDAEGAVEFGSGTRKLVKSC